MQATKNGVMSVGLNHLVSYPTPINFNYMYGFGSLAGFCPVSQIFSGFFMAFFYIPLSNMAFMSVEFVMRDVPWGWLGRYIHSNGSSMFFMCVYAHMLRAFYHGSFVKPRHWTWTIGVVVLILMMATAFLGYVLPWGQMSYWALTVISNFLTILPKGGGKFVLEWLYGGFSINTLTPHRVFSLHYLMPFILAAATCVHLAVLHNNGSTNPLTVDGSANSIPFYPYFAVKDFYGLSLFFGFFSFFLVLYPNVLGHTVNYIYANDMKTPPHIVPEWYFLPFYAILRSIPHKTPGILLMGASIVVFFPMPLLVNPVIKGAVSNKTYKLWLAGFVGNVVFLGWIGQQKTVEPFLSLGMAATITYFIFFAIVGLFVHP